MPSLQRHEGYATALVTSSPPAGSAGVVPIADTTRAHKGVESTLSARLWVARENPQLSGEPRGHRGAKVLSESRKRGGMAFPGEGPACADV